MGKLSLSNEQRRRSRDFYRAQEENDNQITLRAIFQTTDELFKTVNKEETTVRQLISMVAEQLNTDVDKSLRLWVKKRLCARASWN